MARWHGNIAFLALASALQVTLYDMQNGFFIPNDRNKYSVGENAGMKLNEDGGIDIHIAASKPDGVPEQNWVQTIPGKGWFVYIRLYGPEQAYFDNTWVPGDAEKLN